jgi:hypothetical protein
MSKWLSFVACFCLAASGLMLSGCTGGSSDTTFDQWADVDKNVPIDNSSTQDEPVAPAAPSISAYEAYLRALDRLAAASSFEFTLSSNSTLDYAGGQSDLGYLGSVKVVVAGLDNVHQATDLRVTSGGVTLAEKTWVKDGYCYIYSENPEEGGSPEAPTTYQYYSDLSQMRAAHWRQLLPMSFKEISIVDQEITATDTGYKLRFAIDASNLPVMTTPLRDMIHASFEEADQTVSEAIVLVTLDKSYELMDISISFSIEAAAQGGQVSAVYQASFSEFAYNQTSIEFPPELERYRAL